MRFDVCISIASVCPLRYKSVVCEDTYWNTESNKNMSVIKLRILNKNRPLYQVNPKDTLHSAFCPIKNFTSDNAKNLNY